MPRHLYQLEGQTLRLVRDRMELAKDQLIELANKADDVPEWNRGGQGYRAAELLDEGIKVLSQILKEEDAS